MGPTPDAQPAQSGSVAVTCSECGKATSVPFTPTPGRPVYCRECFAKRQPARPAGGGFRGPGGPSSGGRPPYAGGPPRFRDAAPPSGRAATNARKRMLAQGRKGHFIYDARAILRRTEGGMDDQHHRAFLEGLFARGARDSTAAARDFLDEKLADATLTVDEHRALSDLIERYSFWR